MPGDGDNFKRLLDGSNYTVASWQGREDEIASIIEAIKATLLVRDDGVGDILIIKAA